MTAMPTNTATLGQAVRAVAAQCDGAHSRDGAGFSGTDTRFGKALARVPEHLWDDETKATAYQMLAKYRGQLAQAGIVYDAIPKPGAVAEATRASAATKVSKVIEVENGVYVIRFRYDPGLVEKVRQIPGRRWDGANKNWTAPLTSAVSVKRFASANGFTLLESAAERLLRSVAAPAVQEAPEPVQTGVDGSVTIEGNRYVITFGYDSRIPDDVRMLPGREWDKDAKVWRVPVTTGGEGVLHFAKKWGLTIAPEIEAAATAVAEKAKAMREASKAEDADLTIPGLTTNLTPYGYQKAGVAYALQARDARGRISTFIADEPGLGKTVQAIATVIHERAFPVVCVVPASLRLNWKREWEMWEALGLRIQILTGTKGGQIGGLYTPDVLIVNYDVLGKVEEQYEVDQELTRMAGKKVLRTDPKTGKPIPLKGPDGKPLPPILHGHLADLVALKPAALIVDECHACFVAGTRVATPNGDREIQSLLVGDAILSAAGVDRVNSIGNRQVRTLAKVTRRDGLNFVCSIDHPMFTQRGLQAAGDLRSGDYLYGQREALRVVQQGSRSEEEQILRSLLLSEMADAPAIGPSSGVYPRAAREGEPGGAFLSRLGPLRRGAPAVERPNAPAQSYGRPCRCREGEGNTQSYGPQAISPRGQRDRTYSSGEGSVGCLGTAVGLELCHSHGSDGRGEGGVSDQLQGGFGSPFSEDRRRSGRWQSLSGGTSGAGPQEGEVSSGAWVDRVEILEQGHPEFDRLSGGGNTVQVFNLSVARHPSYAVDGLLVHNCKTKKAQRTLACTELAQHVTGPVLLLSGTPLVNRPTELIPQLGILGRLREFGGASRFKTRYGDGQNGVELNQRLRATCFLRRRKVDVLPELPPKRWVPIPLETDPVIMAEYERAEADVITYLAEKARQLAIESGADDEAAQRAYWEKHMRASSAEQLVMIGALKLLAAKAKLPAAQAWIKEFVGTGSKLVAFGEHIEIVNAIAAPFGNLKIQGGQSMGERDAVVTKFMTDPEAKVVSCNLQAGGVGLTLTAASDVAFLEQGWTPGGMDQGLDRTHRIGQRDSVTGWVLLADHTIDARISRLIADKRVVVDAVTDGVDAENDAPTAKASVLGDLLIELADEGMNR